MDQHDGHQAGGRQMNAPDRTTREVRDWLRRSSPPPPDAERSVDEAMNTLFRSTQVQPRLTSRLLGGRRGNEGGSLMFTALKLGAATALVALISVFAVSVDRTQDSQVPGAAASPSPSAEAAGPATPAAAVNGRVYPSAVTQDANVIRQTEDPQEIWTDYVWDFRMDTDDPRLDGWFEFHQTIHVFVPDSFQGGSIQSGTGQITNDDGWWSTEFHGFAQPGKNAYHNGHYALTFTGGGGYEGLSAMLLMTPVPGSHWDVQGIIFPGDMPEMPDAVEPPEAD